MISLFPINILNTYLFYIYIYIVKASEKIETCSISEDIIELQDVRMSPIASLRNRHYANVIATAGSSGSDTLDLAKFPPSFRITRNYGSNRSASGVRYRGTTTKG